MQKCRPNEKAAQGFPRTANLGIPGRFADRHRGSCPSPSEKGERQLCPMYPVRVDRSTLLYRTAYYPVDNSDRRRHLISRLLDAYRWVAPPMRFDVFKPPLLNPDVSPTEMQSPFPG
jgi:hypothetical protein